MSRIRLLTGVIVALFATMMWALPMSSAKYSDQSAGTVHVMVTIPPQTPPFDWNWTYPAPTCRGVTVVFPSNLPVSQQGVMEVNVIGGSLSGISYKLEGYAYRLFYPQGHAGKTVFIPWTEFRNFRARSSGQWTVTRLRVHGTNYQWSGRLKCGNDKDDDSFGSKSAALAPTPSPSAASPQATLLRTITPTPTPMPTSTPSPSASREGKK